MRILGFSGGPDPAYPSQGPDDFRMLDASIAFHDAAAVLLCDGKLVAGIEEERLSRLKHTNKFPAHAIRFCLESAGLSPGEVDRFAYYGKEQTTDLLLGRYMLGNPHVRPVWKGRMLLAEALERELGTQIDPARIMFVEHHVAHAVSAYAMSPFEDALIVTLDGQGDMLAGTVFAGRAGKLQRLADIPATNSLGNLYTNAIGFLGYGLFDEYKVMGLAPYGDPSRYRSLMEQLCVLAPDGTFAVKNDKIPLLATIGPPRRAGEPFTQAHKDLAAALQETIERAVLHHVARYRKETGLTRLCLAGGLAHNCSANGKILASGLFEDVFVQPASHDAGCALGAALSVHLELCAEQPVERTPHVYWGTSIGENAEILSTVERWQDLVEYRTLHDTPSEVARLIADGAVVGWVQGRSEFGPRALGNRSIVADPRPAENKDRINQLVKKREAYRPFAPAVQAEYVHEFFEVAPGSRLDFMTFVVGVREEQRARLGAITHVDGTARVQTVARDTNPRFWELIDAFRERTGLPILLNTSLNNHVEPLVDSVEDALVCFLTTGLTYLVVGDILVEKRSNAPLGILSLAPSLPMHIRLVHARQTEPGGNLCDVYCTESTAGRRFHQNLSEPSYRLLMRANGKTPLRTLTAEMPQAQRDALLAELRGLWERRIIRLLPSTP